MREDKNTFLWLLFRIASISTDNVELSSLLFHWLLALHGLLGLLSSLIFSSLSVLFLKGSSSSLGVSLSFILLIGLINVFSLLWLLFWLKLRVIIRLLSRLNLLLLLKLFHCLPIMVLESISFPFCKCRSWELRIRGKVVVFKCIN